MLQVSSQANICGAFVVLGFLVGFLSSLLLLILDYQMFI